MKDELVACLQAKCQHLLGFSEDGVEILPEEWHDILADLQALKDALNEETVRAATA